MNKVIIHGLCFTVQIQYLKPGDGFTVTNDKDSPLFIKGEACKDNNFLCIDLTHRKLCAVNRFREVFPVNLEINALRKVNDQ